MVRDRRRQLLNACAIIALISALSLVAIPDFALATGPIDERRPTSSNQGNEVDESDEIVFELADPPAQADIDKWIRDLGHDLYLRRESATRNLVGAGPMVIESLANSIRGSELETVERSVKIIMEIAIGRPPNQDGGAWEALQQMSNLSGRQASLASTAIEAIRDRRSKQAAVALTKAGIFVGEDEFVIRASSAPTPVVHIDKKWNGKTAQLQWLRWLDGIGHVRVKDIDLTRDVVGAITDMPNLRAIVIANTPLREDALEPLQELPQINSIEIRYVRLSEQQCEQLGNTPIRYSLTLMGTGISQATIAKLGDQLPGLDIIVRQGGFLGVRCIAAGFDECRISEVVPRSAAEEAGLAKDDVILRVGDAEVARFEDLQEAINLHIPGDELEVQFRRGNRVSQTVVRLRQFVEL